MKKKLWALFVISSLSFYNNYALSDIHSAHKLTGLEKELEKVSACIHEAFQQIEEAKLEWGMIEAQAENLPECSDVEEIVVEEKSDFTDCYDIFMIDEHNGVIDEYNNGAVEIDAHYGLVEIELDNESDEE